MYPRRHGAIFSQLACEGRVAVVDSSRSRRLTDQAAGAKFKAMGLDSVLVIIDRSTTTCAGLRATWPTLLVVNRATPIRCRWSFYKKVV